MPKEEYLFTSSDETEIGQIHTIHSDPSEEQKCANEGTHPLAKCFVTILAARVNSHLHLNN